MKSRSWHARLAMRIAERAARVLFGRGVRVPQPASTVREAELAARADELNAAAERYFAEYPHPEFLLGKPYSDFRSFPRYLFNLGVLFHSLRLAPGDVVLELGAGSCWVSHFLNRMGCTTVAVDVSSTVLELGRRLFESDPRTRWELEPQFLPYDGHRLPVEDASCDRIVLHDAFHHLPNSEEILGEMARVLRPGGIVAMSEPGRDHSASAEAVQEVTATGVLENDVVAERIAAAALRCGFTKVEVAPVALDVPPVPASEQIGFLYGQRHVDFWLGFAAENLKHQFLVLSKGEEAATTRRPSRLRARIEPVGRAAEDVLRGPAGGTIRLCLRLENTGDSVWLAGTGQRPGDALAGIRLLPEGAQDHRRQTVDWCRGLLPHDLAPDEELEIDLELPLPQAAGRYRLRVDMVAEQVAWFADRGSPALDLTLEVEPAD